MQFFPNQQTFITFSIGSLTFEVRWYAVLILTGALLAYYFSRKEMKKVRYIDSDFFDSLFVYTLWAGIAGARLWYCVFFNFEYYFSNPVEIIRVWDGGLAIQGGLVFGTLFAYWFIRKNRYPFFKITDMIFPNVLLAQAIGRWGNYINQECHGAEVSEEYFNGILSFLKEGMYINGHYYEPMFFYESMLCLLGWVLIYFVLKKYQNKRGDLVYAYLMWYGLIRFFIEGRRTDSLYLGNFKMAQLTSIVFFIIGLLGYLGVFEKFIKKEKPTLIFDFDGTLMDTRTMIVEGYRALFKKYSDESKFTEEIQHEVIGPALPDLFSKYFPGEDFDTLYADYKARQEEVMKDSVRPTLHSPEVLKALHDDGYKIGIISTRSKEGIRRILGDFELNEYVDDVCGVNDAKKIKPDPEGIFSLVNNNKWNREVAVIGDSVMDIECGLNYGAYTVAYLSDASRSQELAAIANESITDMEDLLEIVKKDIYFTYNLK